MKKNLIKITNIKRLEVMLTMTQGMSDEIQTEDKAIFKKN